MPNWQVMNARLTFFVAPDAQIPSTLWRDTLGEEPEATAFQRATLTRNESGLFADGKLSLVLQPMRIDWIHEPSSEGITPILGPFPGAVEPLLSIGSRSRANGSSPPTNRIALGFVLISPTPDRETGYRELREFIDGVPSTPDAVDFQYQVNRPRVSNVIEGLQVNRLSKWSVGGVRLLRVTLAGRTMTPTITPIEHHLHLELDISTAADFQEILPEERIQDVIADLFRGAQEINEHGNHF